MAEPVIFRYFNVAGADPEAEVGEFHQPETHLIPSFWMRGRQKGRADNLWYRLRHAGWDVHQRLRPRVRPRRRTCLGPEVAPRWQEQPCLQSGQR